MVMVFIISIIAAMTLFALGIFNDDTGVFPLGVFFCIAVELAVILGIVLFVDVEKSPQPIDVYRGKTTLEITYRDSIAIDSVVVFKTKEE